MNASQNEIHQTIFDVDSSCQIAVDLFISVICRQTQHPLHDLYAVFLKDEIYLFQNCWRYFLTKV